MEEVWQSIINYPLYEVSNHGEIRNKNSGRPVRLSTTRQGGVKVSLICGTTRHTRSVKVLVADAFVDGQTDVYDTPIQLDGDQSNVDASNLMWRPRWFAWRYARQFHKADTYIGLGPLCDQKTGLMYKDIYEAATKNGLLFLEIQMSLVNRVPVFPTFHLFDWIGDNSV